MLRPVIVFSVCPALTLQFSGIYLTAHTAYVIVHGDWDRDWVRDWVRVTIRAYCGSKNKEIVRYFLDFSFSQRRFI